MKEMWIVLGVLSMGMGFVGVILPILPTTPFFILTGYAFTRGSQRFSTWFHSRKIVQTYLSNMKMTRRKKWMLNLFVDGICITYAIIFHILWIRILLFFIIVVKHYVFYKYVETQ